MSARPIRTETGFADDARVRGLVEVCHPPRREALPRTTGDRSTVKAGQSIDGEGCLVHVVDQEPVDTVLDDLRKRTRAAADDGGPEGQGLDRDETERLWPGPEHQRRG